LKNENNTQCEILGAGAVGHLLACVQSFSGFDCNLLSRSIDTPEAKNVQFDSVNHHCDVLLNYHPINAPESIELLFVCVKSYDLSAALSSIKHRLTAESTIVLMQNGMGNLEIAQSVLADCVPGNRIFIAINTHGALLEKDSIKTKVRHTGLGKLVIGGNYLLDSPANINLRLMSQFSSELDPNWSKQINRELWLKLGINAVINPLTALNQCPNGALVEQPILSKHANLLIKEVCTVFDALELEISPQQFTDYYYKVVKNTAQNYSSMMLDYRSKKPLELEAITGYLLNSADKVKIDLTEHQNLYTKLQKG